MEFEPWAGKSEGTEALTGENWMQHRISVVFAHATMFMSKRDLINLHRDVDPDHVDQLMANIFETAEWLKAVAFMTEGAQARLLASACAAVDEGVIGNGTLPLHLADVRSTPASDGAMTMTSNVVKFPYDACRRVHSRKPRRSKNGTPEERAAKAGAAQGSPAAVVELATNETTDRRKLRGNPLRESYGLISPAVTIIGKIYTANLRQDGWWDTAITENWLQTLEGGAAAARYVADELDKRAKSISLAAKYDGLPLEEKQIVSAEVDRLLRSKAQSETSDFLVKLPVPDLGQSVLNLAIEQDE